MAKKSTNGSTQEPKLFGAEKDVIFKWSPAAITYPSDGGLGIYIKYGKNPNRIVLKEEGNGYLWVQCPDRDLVLVSNSHQGSWGFRPMNGNYDEYVHIGPYHDHLNEDMNLPYFMVNYLADSSKKYMANSRVNLGADRNPNSLIMADSGGFQILQGRVEYLDPAQIIEWYNNNVDLGFTLDVPVNNVELALLTRSAKVHANNNQVMLDGKKDGVELINILHGSTLDRIQMYRDIVDHPEIDRMSVGGLYHYFNLLASIDALHQISNTGQKYKHLHVLGVSNTLHVALLIRMATKGLVPMLTSDSSTAMQKARLREWHTVTAIHEKVKFNLIGYKDGYRPSPNMILPCSCQVCSAIKYADVLWCLKGNTATKLFEFHNIHSMSRYFDTMVEINKEISTQELKELYKRQIGDNRQGFDDAIQTLDFIDMLGTGDYAKAQAKYQYYLGNSMFNGWANDSADQKSKPMFNLSDDEADFGSSDDADYVVDYDFKFGDDILKRYEDDKRTAELKHGRKLKTEVANTRKTKNASGGTAKPITASQMKKHNIKKADAQSSQKT